MKTLYQRFSFKIALFFFSIGTLLFITYFITNSDVILFLGFYYTVVAVFVNLIIELGLFFKLIKEKNNRKENFMDMLLIACNIPIAYLYFIIVMTNVFND